MTTLEKPSGAPEPSELERIGRSARQLWRDHPQRSLETLGRQVDLGRDARQATGSLGDGHGNVASCGALGQLRAQTSHHAFPCVDRLPFGRLRKILVCRHIFGCIIFVSGCERPERQPMGVSLWAEGVVFLGASHRVLKGSQK